MAKKPEEELSWWQGQTDWVSEVLIGDGRYIIEDGTLTIDFANGYEFTDSDGYIHKGPISEIKDLAGEIEES